MRIDADTDIDGYSLPNDTFNLVGTGGQFDNSAPHSSGYQILPRTIRDLYIDNYHATIQDVRKVDSNGVSLLEGRRLLHTAL